MIFFAKKICVANDQLFVLGKFLVCTQSGSLLASRVLDHFYPTPVRFFTSFSLAFKHNCPG
jgi:hypothetical protein